MLIVMAGLPGTGKSTIAGVLGGRLNASVVSVDPIESAILSAGIDNDQPTGLAAYLVAETIAGVVIESGHDVIIDAVNAVHPAREQWVTLGHRLGEVVRFIEVTCSDPVLHRGRLQTRYKELPHVDEPSWHAVEQSLEEYAEWTGPSAAVARIRLDSVNSLGSNIALALAFLEGTVLP